MSQKDRVAKPSPRAAWTTPDDYVGALIRKRSFQRAHRPPERSQPETPRMLLSTLPFVALFALLAVLTIGIMILAFPGNQPVMQSKPAQHAHEQGVAEPGWFQKAQKEMHR